MKALMLIKKYWYLAAIGVAYAAMAGYAPAKAGLALSITWHTVTSVALIIMSVFVLIGLVQAWLKEELIAKKLGEGSGFKAILLSSLIGSFLVGPLFAIFPLLKSLLERGARVGVIVAMLTTWAVKIPMLPLEVKFLGAEFAALRIALVLLLAVPVSLLMEKLVSLKPAEKVEKVAEPTPEPSLAGAVDSAPLPGTE